MVFVLSLSLYSRALPDGDETKVGARPRVYVRERAPTFPASLSPIFAPLQSHRSDTESDSGVEEEEEERGGKGELLELI